MHHWVKPYCIQHGVSKLTQIECIKFNHEKVYPLEIHCRVLIGWELQGSAEGHGAVRACSVCGRGCWTLMAFLMHASLLPCALPAEIDKPFGAWYGKPMLLWALWASRWMTKLLALTAFLMVVIEIRLLRQDIEAFWAGEMFRSYLWGGSSVGNWTIWSVDGWKEKASLTFTLFVRVWSVSIPQQSYELSRLKCPKKPPGSEEIEGTVRKGHWEQGQRGPESKRKEKKKSHNVL